MIAWKARQPKYGPAIKCACLGQHVVGTVTWSSSGKEGERYSWRCTLTGVAAFAATEEQGKQVVEDQIREWVRTAGLALATIQ